MNDSQKYILAWNSFVDVLLESAEEGVRSIYKLYRSGSADDFSVMVPGMTCLILAFRKECRNFYANTTYKDPRRTEKEARVL